MNDDNAMDVVTEQPAASSIDLPCGPDVPSTPPDFPPPNPAADTGTPPADTVDSNAAVGPDTLAEKIEAAVERVAHSVGDWVRHLFAQDSTHTEGEVKAVHADGTVDVLTAGGMLITAPAEDFASAAPSVDGTDA